MGTKFCDNFLWLVFWWGKLNHPKTFQKISLLLISFNRCPSCTLLLVLYILISFQIIDRHNMIWKPWVWVVDWQTEALLGPVGTVTGVLAVPDWKSEALCWAMECWLCPKCLTIKFNRSDIQTNFDKTCSVISLLLEMHDTLLYQHSGQVAMTNQYSQYQYFYNLSPLVVHTWY